MEAKDLVFIDVDTQRDFCEEDGALYVPRAPVRAFRQLTELAIKKRIPIVGSVDTHSFDAWEFASNKNVGPNGEDPQFPDHCVKGTPGWLKVEGTLPLNSRLVNVDKPWPVVFPYVYELREGRCQAVYFEKEVYSLFANPNAAPLLRGLERKTAVVYGVATEYCVKAAALGLRERGYNVHVVADAIAGITQEGKRAATHKMLDAGVTFLEVYDLETSLA